MHQPQGPEPVRQVALVDDDASVRRSLARLLTAYAFSVRTYPSGLEFLESLENSVPDCLMLDLQLPVMTGLEVLGRLAAGGFSFPVVVVTAEDELGIRSRCQLAGATTFLAKPFTTESLVEVLTSVLEKRAEDMTASQADES